MKPFLRKKTSHILLFGLFVVIFSGVYYLGFYNETQIGTNIFTATLKDTRSSNEHIVELREDGFYPEELEINKGDTVKFKTTRDKLFWPASNLHPSHGIYSEFDPREPINPEDRWSFRFEKTGEWKYHDHLAPIYKGEIIVSEGGVSKFDNDCGNESENEQKIQCWVDLIDSVLEKKNIPEAFELIQALYETEPEFQRACHDTMHSVGEVAYNKFIEGKDLILTTDTIFCSFGFYHGFMETLIAISGDVDGARDFCAFVDEKLRAQVPDIFLQCYHGIGHGSVEEHFEELWGDERAMIRGAIEVCRSVSDTHAQLFRCGTGLFDAISIAYYTGAYNLSMDMEDPLWLCREPKEDALKQACYVSMASALFFLTDLNLSGAAEHIEKIEEDKYAAMVMGNLAMPISTIKDLAGADVGEAVVEFYKKESVYACRAIQERLHLPCIQGVVNAIIFDEGYEYNYNDGFDYCDSDILSGEESEICFDSMLNKLKMMYSPEKFEKVCQIAGEQYGESCPPW